MQEYINAAERDIESLDNLATEVIDYMGRTMRDERYSTEHKRQQVNERKTQELSVMQATIQKRLEAIATQTAQAEQIMQAVHIPNATELQQIGYLRDYFASQWLTADDAGAAIRGSYQNALASENPLAIRAHQVYAPSFAASHITDKDANRAARVQLEAFNGQAVEKLMSTEQRQARDFLNTIPSIKSRLQGAVQRVSGSDVRPDGSVTDGAIADIRQRFGIPA